MKVFISYVIENGSKQKFGSEVINTFIGSNLPYNQCEPPSIDEVHKWMEQKRDVLKNEGTLTILGMSKVK
ncbi:MAG: hypothetical protein WD139_10830 [Balneolaceae bacterium]